MILFLREECPVFYPAWLFSRNVDVQLSYQRFEGLRVFGFPFLVIFACRLSSILFISSCSSSDSDPSYDILNLADVANVANSIPQSVAS